MNENTATLTLPETETTDAARALREEILRLKQQRRAVILAHNYQVPEIQDLDSKGFTKSTPEPAKSSIFRVARVRSKVKAVAAKIPSITGKVRVAMRWPQRLMTDSDSGSTLSRYCCCN